MTADRFWSKVREDDGCWVWTAARQSKGYGSFYVPGVGRLLAHRFSYEFFIAPIPSGLELDHLCRVRRCVNPWHLEPVTPRVNNQRGAKGQKTHCDHGHEYTPENTYRSPSHGRRSCRTCIIEHGRARRLAEKAAA
jgi:hypothetical protein